VPLGENGLFGQSEEAEKIEPGVKAAQAPGINAVGPLPADKLFFPPLRITDHNHVREALGRRAPSDGGPAPIRNTQQSGLPQCE
jgi:hypothetical protein